MITIAEAIARLSRALGGSAGADLAAAALVEADALGLPRFGIAMLDEWAGRAQEVEACADQGPLRWRDCSASFAPLAVAHATLDIELAARQYGVAAFFLRGVKGFGRLAPFVRRLADAGLVGIAGAEGPPFVAPYDGRSAVIGTNPFAFAIGQGEDRIVVDLATASLTMADVRDARATGRKLPAGKALDHLGRPTSIAADVAALLPRDGRAGSLLGLVVELLAGIAGQGRGDSRGRGVFLMAIDPEAGGDTGHWRELLASLKTEWMDAGGHWPRGGGLAGAGELDDAFAQRLGEHLARITGKA
ncbi:MAG: Ldh family oxidoreductase [Chelatococcus sp.]|uniref:Ldh family oxidoreductase n=1 Tax=unclassified Chelatococcus TaxID=2638111 RepID=UPI001BCCE728|nr:MULTISPECIES: Ldh family oxidoreductase [unclassified Chelatococcus]CAH1658211.1 (2R)-3-sulfolactate dehydrogenase (NADP+) [Hyphomicrobiales bacterium]MBS7742203.1 Ldh family oxidoreductase [Chelatococcus sp. HY11]MBX3539145.1 Ldh family oxidoreductase [Chelatococcus sp.]MBX3542679.1 Ldh family oxidoreductase [Chelatococcus sp.]MCO5075105.1 Ldh family oxidoreductase [Chelatococcus sp.]